jgi:hypothetical protein
MIQTLIPQFEKPLLIPTLVSKLVSRLKLDLIAGGSFFGFMLAFIYIPASVMWKNPLPPASGAAVTMEQVRKLTAKNRDRSSAHMQVISITNYNYALFL